MTDTNQKIADEMRALARHYHRNAHIVRELSAFADRIEQSLSAGASGGGEPFGYYIETLPPKAWECTFTRAPEIAAMQEAAASGRVKVTPLYTTPASPATDHCTCPSETRCAGTCPYYQRLHTTPPAHGDGEGALAYATRLANALWRMHYMDEAPEWEACPDLMGVLSQIDNMTTGLTRPTPEAQEARDGLEELRALMSEVASDREGALVSFFRTTGSAMGRYGDAMGWTPEQTARHFLAIGEKK